MKTKIARHGNSVAVVIPAAVAEDLGWEIGSAVEIARLINGISIQRPSKRSIDKSITRVIRDHATLIKELAER